MIDFKIGDRVRCVEAIPPFKYPGIPVGYTGTIQNILTYETYPYRILWDSSVVLSREPLMCGARAYEIELA